jgi:hypothetical protein
MSTAVNAFSARRYLAAASPLGPAPIMAILLTANFAVDGITEPMLCSSIQDELSNVDFLQKF